jgi:hypothetical protein
MLTVFPSQEGSLNDILQDLSAPALARAIEANQVAVFQHFRCWPAAEVHAANDLTWTLTSVPFPLFNSVLGARLSPETADAAIEAAIARGTSRQVPMMWWTGPSTQPDDLATRLKAHGFILEGESPGMAADLHALPEQLQLPSGLSIEYMGDAVSLRPWADVLCTGFDMPGIVGDAMVEWSVSSGFGENARVRSYLGRWHDERLRLHLCSSGAGWLAFTTSARCRRRAARALERL